MFSQVFFGISIEYSVIVFVGSYSVTRTLDRASVTLCESQVPRRKKDLSRLPFDPFIFTFVINKICTHSFILITVGPPLVMLLNFTLNCGGFLSLQCDREQLSVETINAIFKYVHSLRHCSLLSIPQLLQLAQQHFFRHSKNNQLE